MQSKGISRRQALALAAGAASLPMGFHAQAQSTAILRAGITGFAVINTFDPAKVSLIPESYVVWAVFNALVKFNAKMEIVPDLAESYSFVEPTVLEFKLRKGVKFHDGTEMTSDDVRFSLERVMDEKTASPNRAKLSSIKTIETPDAFTVRIVTHAPFAPLLTYLANTRTGTQIVPRKTVEALGEKFALNPVGTGAYKLQEWKVGSSVRLEAFADYFGGAPKIPTVTMPLIPEESSGLTALQGGQIDLTSTAPFASIPGLANNPKIKVYKQAGLNTRYIALNNRKAPFDDPHFRRALSMAFDRQAMVRSVVFGEGSVPPGLLPPAIAKADQPMPPLLSFNPTAAKAELAKSKYPADTEVKLLIWGPAWWRKIGEFFVLQVNQVLGTKMQIEAGESNAVFGRLRAGDFQASVWGWLGLIDADEYLGDLLGKGGSRNFQGYDNPVFDALLLKGQTEPNLSSRQDIYRQAELVMLEDMPLLPCFCSNVHNLSVPNLKGFEQLPFSNYGDQFSKLDFS
ncbi:ABC transporter substrate-binding protein [Bradyrhizobium sp. 142]|uniref:ABC transporter substrate-binding protein n=1 Tax=Bradyrhizobium sp. 142 TaxID=2782618 RepID=UPI001FF8B2CC|nr:ABC transporter substrate-binding protein [Bradyrhizobium sp. 142]MCK1732319.1 ABC transporter substrate-binding protein [Bradyrhizobium sp. 142]